MNGGSRIIAFGSSESDEADASNVQSGTENGGDINVSENVLDAVQDTAGFEAGEVAPVGTRRWIPAMIAIIAAGAWTTFFAWANWPAIATGFAPSVWTSLISSWCLPILLLSVIWLIVMRSSTRESARFADAAGSLANESSRLESRLLAVNRELSLAREFLASESRDLEALGRIATERLSKNAERLHELVRENGSRVETIGNVSETALGNMEKLRSQLPVISSSAKDVANNIGNAGRTAHNQIEEMVRGFKRINEFSQACETQVFSLRSIVEDTLSGLLAQSEQLEKAASSRFAELSEQGEEFRTRLGRQEVEALAAIRQRAAVLIEELEQARAILASDEASSLSELRSMIATFRDESNAISREIRADEENALTNWRNVLIRIEEDRSALFARIEQSDTTAIETTRNRLAAIQSEADLIDRGIAERAERVLEELSTRREAAQDAERDAIAHISEMLSALDGKISERAEAHQTQAEKMADQLKKITGSLGDSEAEISKIAQAAGNAGERISESLSAISGRLSSAKATLVETERRFDGLNDSSVRLLELLSASAEQAGGTLPRSLAESESALSAAHKRSLEITEALQTAGRNGQWLANQIEGSGSALKTILTEISKMQFQLRDQSISHQEVLGDLSRKLKDIESQSEAISEKSRSELSEAIGAMEAAAQETLTLISEQGSAGIEQIADKIRTSSADAIGNAIHNSVADVSGQLEQAAAHAAGISREATLQLRDQLSKVNELVSNLETRVTRAREHAEEQVNNDFARRAALITESLNSNAIDIAKALSTDVSDTAWEGYLRGDRGIFTRRAVSLIDNSDSRSIQQVFDRDSEFREHVSRYIHDFESILRQVLSTRDGKALGVTLLSSDMGKLYVALAQAIERLRT